MQLKVSGRPKLKRERRMKDQKQMCDNAPDKILQKRGKSWGGGSKEAGTR